PTAVFVEQAQAGQVANGPAGAKDAGGDLHEAIERLEEEGTRHLLVGIGRGRAGDANAAAHVEEQGAANGHLALELLGDEPVATGADLPGNGTRGVTGDVIAQVEQLAATAGLAQAVDAGGRQFVAALDGRPTPAADDGGGQDGEQDLRTNKA